MRLGYVIALGGMYMVGVGGCQPASTTTTASTGERIVAKADATREAATLGRVKALAGEWVRTDGEHAGEVASVFTVTAGGSSVREIMFPGSPHEMTNMYHLDGPDMIATHYCAAGNQPRMRCTAPEANQLHFAADGVTNLHDASKEHMAELTLVFNPDGTLTEVWRSMAGGKLTEHVSFTYRRKQ